MMVQLHNDWTSLDKAIISLLGWSIFIKGIAALLVPNSLIHFAEGFKSSKQMTAWAIVPLILGIYLGYIGFLA